MAEAEALVEEDQAIPGKKEFRIQNIYMEFRMKTLLRVRLLFCFCLFLITNSFAQKPIPELWGQRVHDDAHILQQSTIDQLEKRLKSYEDSTSNQIAILIVQSLDGSPIEEYSIRVAEKWKLGQKGKDNGVLLILAVDYHKIRIEVGQGLEGVLTDALSSRIIRNEIAPALRRGDYDDGVIAGIHGIIKAIGGEYSAEETSSDDITGIVIAIIVGLFFVIILIVAFVREFSSKKQEAIVPASKKKFSKVVPKLKNKKSKIGGPLFVPSSSSGSGTGSSGGSDFVGGGGNFGGGGSSGSW